MTEDRKFMEATPEEVARIDAALEAVKGHRGLAAKAIGMEPKRVYNLVTTNPYLRAKWCTKVPVVPEPGLASEMHRDAPLSPFSKGDEEVAIAVTKEDAKLHRGWNKLPGFGTKERKFLAQLQNTYAGNFKGTMDLAYGGAAHANARLLLALENLTEKLHHIDEHPEEYTRDYMTEHGTRETKSAEEYRLEYYDRFIKIAEALRKSGDSMAKANELRLRVEKMRAQKEGPKKVAGWESPAKGAAS